MYTYWQVIYVTAMCPNGVLLYVTEQSHPPQDPVLWVSGMSRGGGCTQTDCCDVRQVSASWLLVDWAEVELGVSKMVRGVDCIQVDHRERGEEHLGRWLHQTTALAVPASTIQVQSIHIHSLWRWVGHIFPHHTGHVIVQQHRVECPALVSASHLLSHGCQEALRIEEASHPEHVRPGLEDPAGELAVPLQQFCEPESQCG